MVKNNKKVFIDFGPGDNGTKLKEYKERGFYTIAFDGYTTFHEDLADRSIESLFSKDIKVKKADEWVCSSVLEHIEPDEIKDSLKGIIKKIKKNSIGKIHIDLTDHNGSFEHYKDDNILMWDLGWDYINTIKHVEWIQILSEFFTFETKLLFFKEGDEFPRAIKFLEVKVK
tara:strand:+ start:268 stop:780 length:513 start_codon:yes stop_codon:yes gene_type:complete